MQDIPTSEVPVGSRLARPVLDDKGRVLLRDGATLTDGVISRLEKWHVSAVCIETDPVEQNIDLDGASASPPAEVSSTPNSWKHFLARCDDSAEAAIIYEGLVLWRERGCPTTDGTSDREVSS